MNLYYLLLIDGNKYIVHIKYINIFGPISHTIIAFLQVFIEKRIEEVIFLCVKTTALLNLMGQIPKEQILKYFHQSSLLLEIKFYYTIVQEFIWFQKVHVFVCNYYCPFIVRWWGKNTYNLCW
jgi:hypothetical protein